MSETRTRFATAVVLIPLFLVSVAIGGVVFLGAVLVLTAVGAWEFFGMAAWKLYRPRRLPGVALAVSLPAVLYLAPHSATAVPALLVAAIVGVGLAQLLDAEGDEAVASVAVTILGASYVGLLMGFQILVREVPRQLPGAPYWFGALLLAVPILLTWANDTAAYFVGHRWGRHKLIPRVSPGKSVEGALGGLVATAILAFPVLWAVNRWVDLFSPLDAAAIGVLIGITAPCGDLVESSFKRDLGVKDSSRLIPGHGGILDRFDSLLVTVPVFYYWLERVVL